LVSPPKQETMTMDYCLGVLCLISNYYPKTESKALIFFFKICSIMLRHNQHIIDFTVQARTQVSNSKNIVG
jgi:hypothetical protein